MRWARGPFVAASLAALSTLAACSFLRELDDLEPGPASDAGASDAGRPDVLEASDARTSDDAAPKSKCPEGMIGERFPDGTGYCIDRTEVTQSAYEGFLTRDAGRTTTPAECGGNTSFRPDEPTADPDSGCESSFDPSGSGTLPVVCVDQCDARAFCEERGARLCSGKKGNRLPAPKVDDPILDEWFRACSSGGVHPFAAGDKPSGCVFDSSSAAPAASAGCTTAEGVQHLSGNVAEWTDNCGPAPDAGGLFMCLARGGAFLDQAPKRLRCGHENGNARVLEPTARDKAIGFRCCRDVEP